jgi:hypothetical protein
MKGYVCLHTCRDACRRLPEGDTPCFQHAQPAEAGAFAGHQPQTPRAWPTTPQSPWREQLRPLPAWQLLLHLQLPALHLLPAAPPPALPEGQQGPPGAGPPPPPWRPPEHGPCPEHRRCRPPRPLHREERANDIRMLPSVTAHRPTALGGRFLHPCIRSAVHQTATYARQPPGTPAQRSPAAGAPAALRSAAAAGEGPR